MKKREHDGRDMLEEWLEQLETVATMLKWNESTQLIHLVTQLKGQANIFYRSCPTAVMEKYSSLVAELDEGSGWLGYRQYRPVSSIVVDNRKENP